MKKNKLDKSVFILILIFVILIATIIVAFSVFRFDALTYQLNKGTPLTLLINVAKGEDLCFSELLIYHPETKKAGIYYYPPNLGARLESLDRVDAISVLYNKDHPDDLIKKMEQISGLEIGFYLDFQLDQIHRLVDQLEGLEIFVSNPIETKLEDRTILIPSGSVVLHGDKIVDYLLFSMENEESEEIVWRRQKFLQALLRRIGEEEINNQLLTPRGFEYFKQTLSTSISNRDLESLVKEMKEFDAEHIVFQQVEGKITMVEGKKLIFPYFDGDLVKHNVKQLMETVQSKEAFQEDVLNIRLEILNGTTRNGLARNTARLFEGFGYEVLSTGNADSGDYEYTVVYDRQGRPDVAKYIADIISCKRVQTQLAEDLENSIDVTIILGRDFDGQHCKN